MPKLHPTHERPQEVFLVWHVPSGAMIDAGNEEHAREAARRFETANFAAQPIIIVGQSVSTRRRIGKPLPKNELPAALTKAAKIGAAGIVQGTTTAELGESLRVESPRLHRCGRVRRVLEDHVLYGIVEHRGAHDGQRVSLNPAQFGAVRFAAVE